MAIPSTTSSSLSESIDHLLFSLIKAPLPISSGTHRGILTASSVKNSIFSSLYRPEGWPRLATALASLLHNSSGTALYALGHPPFELAGAYDDNPFGRTMFHNSDPTSSRAVVCGDSDPLDSDGVGKDSLDKLIHLAHALEEIAPMGGEGWALSHTGGCRHWGARGQAVESFKGPWSNLTATK